MGGGGTLLILIGQKNGDFMIDFIKATYPTILVLGLFPILILIPWAGLILSIILFMLWEKWWSCIFGLMNTISILIGIAIYGINTISLLFNLMA